MNSASSSSLSRISSKHMTNRSITDIIARTFVKVYNTGELNLQVIEADLSSEKLRDIFCVVRLCTTSTSSIATPSTSPAASPSSSPSSSPLLSSKKHLGTSKKQCKGPIVYKTNYPTWNYQTICNIADKKSDKIMIKVKEYSRVRNKELGRVVVSVNVWEDNSKPIIVWHNFENSNNENAETDGRIKLKVSYTSALRLTKDWLVASSNYAFLMNMLSDDTHYFVQLLSDTNSDTELAQAVVRLVNTCGGNSVLNLLKYLIKKEVVNHARTDGDVNNLFRSDSAAARVVREYFHFTSKWGYLRKQLKPTMDELLQETAKGTNFELPENTLKLADIAIKLLNTLLSAPDSIPLSIRKVFVYLSKVLKDTYSRSSLTPATNLLFLRFLSPNILFPAKLGIIANPEPQLERPCMMLTKIVQSVASGCPFNEADQVMSTFNNIVYTYAEKLSDFLKVVCESPSPVGPADDFRPQYSAEDCVKLMTVIVRRARDSSEEIIKACSQDCPESMKANLVKLCGLLSDPSNCV